MSGKDIVERLQEANGDFYAHERKAIVLEAAAEIARLRAEVERLTATIWNAMELLSDTDVPSEDRAANALLRLAQGIDR